MPKYVEGWSLKPVEVGCNLNLALKVEISIFIKGYKSRVRVIYQNMMDLNFKWVYCLLY